MLDFREHLNSKLALGTLFLALVIVTRTIISADSGADEARSPNPAAATEARLTVVNRPRPLTGQATPDTLDQNSQQWLRDLENAGYKSPHLAIADLTRITDPHLLSAALRAVAAGWAAADPTAAASWLETLETESNRFDAAIGLIPVWAAADPEECLAWTRQQPVGNVREIALVELADAWSENDPAAAFSRFLRLDSENGSERGLHAIVSQWVLDAPENAIESLAQMKNEPRHQEFLQTAVVCLSNQDPAAAWRLSDQFSDPDVVTHVRSMALEAMAETHPLQAASLAAEHGNHETLLGGVARGWAVQDAKAARAWISTLPDADVSKRLKEMIQD